MFHLRSSYNNYNPQAVDTVRHSRNPYPCQIRGLGVTDLVLFVTSCKLFHFHITFGSRFTPASLFSHPFESLATPSSRPRGHMSLSRAAVVPRRRERAPDPGVSPPQLSGLLPVLLPHASARPGPRSRLVDAGADCGSERQTSVK